MCIPIDKVASYIVCIFVWVLSDILCLLSTFTNKMFGMSAFCIWSINGFIFKQKVVLKWLITFQITMATGPGGHTILFCPTKPAGTPATPTVLSVAPPAAGPGKCWLLKNITDILNNYYWKQINQHMVINSTVPSHIWWKSPSPQSSSPAKNYLQHSMVSTQYPVVWTSLNRHMCVLIFKFQYSLRLFLRLVS